MKSIKDNTKLLVEQVLGGNLLDANLTLSSLITETEKQREAQIRHTIFEAEGDDSADDVEGVEDDSTVDGDGNEGETIDTTNIDEPTDGDPNLGDSLDNSVEDGSVSEGEMTEMSNDIVEINCEINQKIINKLFDKISNLKTVLNSKDMDHDTREFITLETKLSYYGNKLEELQSKTNPAIDQVKVEDRINIIEAALKTLEAEIGSPSDISDVNDSAGLEDDESSVDDLGDNTESAVGNDTDTDTEAEVEGSNVEEQPADNTDNDEQPV